MDLFDKKDGKTWESEFRLYNEPYILSSKDDYLILQKIVRILLDQKKPIPIRELPALLQRRPEELNNPLNAGLRYLLFYFITDRETLEPILFVWPRVIEKLNRGTMNPPSPLPSSGEEFSMPFFVYDVYVIVSECAQEPIRLRTTDRQVFEKQYKHLAQQIVPIASWITSDNDEKSSSRVDQAIWVAHDLGFLVRKGSKGANLRYEVSAKGIEWLAFSSKDRMKALVDLDRGESGVEKVLEQSAHYNFLIISGAADNQRLEKNGLKLMRELQKDCYYPLIPLLEYWISERNPLFKLLTEKSESVLNLLGIGTAIRRNSLEVIWRRILTEYLLGMILPLGGVRLNRQSDDSWLLAINNIGLYLIGAESDFEIEEEKRDLVVQPNFEVVFLAPSAQAEAVFLRFAERLGRGVGTLFRITKKSIQRAAGGGITLESILQDLSQMSRAELPQNVRHEVQEWHQSCRRISVRPVYLVECPDETTAARVCAKAGKGAKTVAETSVALPKDFDKVKLYSKLKEMGIFVQKEKG